MMYHRRWFDALDPQPLQSTWRALRLIVAAVAIQSVAVAQDPAALLEDSITKVVELAEPSVVSIARVNPSPDDRNEPKLDEHRPFRRHRDLPRQPTDLPVNETDILPNEYGAGTIIGLAKTANRYILTNLHVVRGGPIYPNFETDDGTELIVRFWDRRSCRSAIIAADPRSDLAVLRLEWEKAGIKPTDFPTLNWETATAPKKGQFVILLGNPYAIARDGSASVSWGLISNLTRQPAPLSRNPAQDMDEVAANSMLYRLGAVMQLDARMNLGTSGGPVLNLKGELIGISTSLAAIEGYDQSVGFALPIDSLTRRIVRTLLAGQEVEYGMLGIFPGEMRAKDFLPLNTGLPQQTAAVVLSVNAGSPAQLMRINFRDVVVRVEGQPVRSVADLMRMVGLHPPDSEIDVTLWRTTNRLETVRIRLGKWPVRDDEGIIETNPRYAPWRGLSVDFPTARGRFIHPAPPDFHRVVVTKVQENSPAHAARLQPGDFITHVDNVAVQSPAEFFAAVKAATGTVSLKLDDSRVGDARAGRIVLVRE